MKSKFESKTSFLVEEEEAPPRECRLFIIEGRVQGVWFRESTRREAQPLGLTGWAQNMLDGTVQVMACGEPEALNRLGAWLENGPPLAQVERVEWIVSRSECPKSFETR